MSSSSSLYQPFFLFPPCFPGRRKWSLGGGYSFGATCNHGLSPDDMWGSYLRRKWKCQQLLELKQGSLTWAASIILFTLLAHNVNEFYSSTQDVLVHVMAGCCVWSLLNKGLYIKWFFVRLATSYWFTLKVGLFWTLLLLHQLERITITICHSTCHPLSTITQVCTHHVHSLPRLNWCFVTVCQFLTLGL